MSMMSNRFDCFDWRRMDGKLGEQTMMGYFNFAGVFDSSLQYKIGDIVTRDGEAFMYCGSEWLRLSINETTKDHDNDVNYKNTIFSCPHCGGNQTKLVKGKRVCAYCNSEIVLNTDMYESRIKESINEYEIPPLAISDGIRCHPTKPWIRYETF